MVKIVGANAIVGDVGSRERPGPRDASDIKQAMIAYSQMKARKENARNAQMGIKDERGETVAVRSDRYCSISMYDGKGIAVLELTQDEFDMFAERAGFSKEDSQFREKFFAMMRDADCDLAMDGDSGNWSIAIGNLKPVIGADGKAVANQYQVDRSEGSGMAVASEEAFTRVGGRGAARPPAQEPQNLFKPLEEYLVQKEETDVEESREPQNYFLSLEEYLGIAPKEENAPKEK